MAHGPFIRFARLVTILWWIAIRVGLVAAVVLAGFMLYSLLTGDPALIDMLTESGVE